MENKYTLSPQHRQNQCLCYFVVSVDLIQGPSCSIGFHTQVIKSNPTQTAHHIASLLADSQKHVAFFNDSFSGGEVSGHRLEIKSVNLLAGHKHINKKNKPSVLKGGKASYLGILVSRDFWRRRLVMWHYLFRRNGFFLGFGNGSAI